MLTNHASALKSWFYGRSPWLRVTLVAALVALGTGIMGALVRDSEGQPPRPAGPVVEGGHFLVFQPMLPGERLSVGSVGLFNMSANPATVELVALRPRKPAGVHLLGFRMMDLGPTASGTDLRYPPVGSHALGDYHIRQYDEGVVNNNAAVVIVGLSVDTGVRGHVEGIDIVYRADGKRHTLGINNSITLCGYATERGPCDVGVGP